MDKSLVDKIVGEVIAALRREGAIRAPSQGAACRTQPAPAARRFLTAEMLLPRLTQAKNSSTVELAANEFLTPAAMDLVARRQLAVTRAAELAADSVAGPSEISNLRSQITDGRCAMSASAAAVTSNIEHRTSNMPLPVGLVVQKPDDKVRGVLAALAHDGIRFLDCSGADCWMVNVTSMCRGLAAGKLSLGVAVLPYAANAMVLANKIAGVRAVQGTRPQSVAAAVRHVGANLLILEHATCTFYELRAMARVFIKDRMLCGAAVDVLAAIAEVEKP